MDISLRNDDPTPLSKDKILELLHRFDNKLKKKVRIDVGGGAAAILAYGVDRRTVDIDVLNSSIPVDSIRDTIIEIATEAKIPLHPHNELWLNDHAKRVKQYLARDYEGRLIKINDTFKNLDLNFISKVDLVITKLAIDKIRERDIDDLMRLKLTIQERNLVLEIIDSISKHDPEFARHMEEKFNDLQPEVKVDPMTISLKKDIKTIDDLHAYAKNVHQFEIPEDFITMWRSDLLSGEIDLATLIKTVDSLVDRYRKEKKCDKERGMDIGRKS